MTSARSKPVPTPADQRASAAEVIPVGARVGTVVALDEGAVPRVDFPGNPHGPLVAMLALSAADAERLARRWQDTEVLIVFASQDIRQPVITGLIRRSLEDPLYELGEWEGFRELTVRSQEELTLQCGEARIVLRRDGKVLIVGKEILSRARERHRIRGATVEVN
jgi:hypothetical protein